VSVTHRRGTVGPNKLLLFLQEDERDAKTQNAEQHWRFGQNKKRRNRHHQKIDTANLQNVSSVFMVRDRERLPYIKSAKVYLNRMVSKGISNCSEW
jgi:hypothetical protein